MTRMKKAVTANLSDETQQSIPVPEFTIRADSPAGMAVMVAAYGMSLMLPDAERQAIAVKMREFELYDEATRDPQCR